MVLAADTPPRPTIDWRTRLMRLAAHPKFQRITARLPILRRISRREGDALFDLVQGFVSSQILYAVVELGLLHRLYEGPQTAHDLAEGTGVSPSRIEAVAQAATALGLMARSGRYYRLTPRGAALLGVPGLEAMIRHHDVLYRDLQDPVAFLRGDTKPELAQFWPYVFGAHGAVDPAVTDRYSDLMTQSQGLVAEDTLRMVSLSNVAQLLDVGGGSGAFAEAALRVAPNMRATVFDLPSVLDSARHRLATCDIGDRITLAPGSFRDDDLPQGADAISLIRVLYDHQDHTVQSLLARVFAALPRSGRLIVSEPMSGGAAPDKAGDVYFAFYCMAMGTGQVRSQTRIAELLQEAGFTAIKAPKALRPFVTSVVTARKP